MHGLILCCCHDVLHVVLANLFHMLLECAEVLRDIYRG